MRSPCTCYTGPTTTPRIIDIILVEYELYVQVSQVQISCYLQCFIRIHSAVLSGVHPVPKHGQSSGRPSHSDVSDLALDYALHLCVRPVRHVLILIPTCIVFYSIYICINSHTGNFHNNFTNNHAITSKENSFSILDDLQNFRFDRC